MAWSSSPRLVENATGPSRHPRWRRPAPPGCRARQGAGPTWLRRYPLCGYEQDDHALATCICSAEAMADSGLEYRAKNSSASRCGQIRMEFHFYWSAYWERTTRPEARGAVFDRSSYRIKKSARVGANRLAQRSGATLRSHSDRIQHHSCYGNLTFAERVWWAPRTPTADPIAVFRNADEHRNKPHVPCSRSRRDLVPVRWPCGRAGVGTVAVGLGRRRCGRRQRPRGRALQPAVSSRPGHRQLRRPPPLLRHRPGEAISYPIAIPRDEDRWEGVTTVSNKRVNPSWTPTPTMIAENPRLPRWVPGGHPMNPLGVRALYLGSSTYRIHGTDAPWTIGTAVSKGCIRMYNQDVLDLYPRVSTGAVVTVTWQRFGSGAGFAATHAAPAHASPVASPDTGEAQGNRPFRSSAAALDALPRIVAACIHHRPLGRRVIGRSRLRNALAMVCRHEHGLRALRMTAAPGGAGNGG